MKIKELKPSKYNPRDITPDQLDRLKKSLLEFGDLSGIIYNRQTGNLVGGHQRIKCLPPDAIIDKQDLPAPSKIGTVAMGKIAIDDESYDYREVDWPLDRERAANIAANKHGGCFNDELLTPILAELINKDGFDVELLGFSKETVNNMIATLSIDVDPDEGKELTEDLKTKHECPKCGYVYG